MIIEETPVQYWGDYSDEGDESFWVVDAMKIALGMLWYGHYRTDAMPDTVTLTLDRERGIVTASTP